MVNCIKKQSIKLFKNRNLIYLEETMMPKLRYWLVGISVVLISGCSNTPKTFNVGECLMPQSEQNQEKIVLVVSVSEKEYKFFTHFFANGSLVQAQDYQTVKKADIENTYVKVVCPVFESTFSPDKYLNEKKQ